MLNTQAADRSLVFQGGLFAYLNSCGLRVQLSISLHLGAEILLFGILTGLSIPSATGSHKNKESYLENHKDVREPRARAGLNKVHSLQETTPILGEAVLSNA